MERVSPGISMCMSADCDSLFRDLYLGFFVLDVLDKSNFLPLFSTGKRVCARCSVLDYAVALVRSLGIRLVCGRGYLLLCRIEAGLGPGLAFSLSGCIGSAIVAKPGVSPK